MSAEHNSPTDAWADVLAGREPRAPLGEVDRAVAEALRAAVRRSEAAADEPSLSRADADVRARRREAYLAAAGIGAVAAAPSVSTASGAGGAATHGPRAGFLARWLPASNQARFAMAAGLAAIAIALPLALMFDRGGQDPLDDGSPPGWRGKSLGSATLSAADPAAKAAEIESQLSGLGAPSRRYVKDGAEVIESKISKDRLDEARRALRPLGVTVPDNGIVVITVRKG